MLVTYENGRKIIELDGVRYWQTFLGYWREVGQEDPPLNDPKWIAHYFGESEKPKHYLKDLINNIKERLVN